MAGLDDVAKNQDMVNIANAIRRVTRTTAPMTIPEMPERLFDIRVIEKKLVELNFNAQGPVSLGSYDNSIKHFFIAMPKANTDAANLARVEPEVDLIYNEETGELSLDHNEVVDVDIEFYVLDLLLPADEDTAGTLLSSGNGGSVILEYSETSSYSAGDVFIYDDGLGLTLVSHGPEEMNYAHNALFARKFVKSGEQVTLIDLVDLSNELQQEKEDRAEADEQLGERITAENERAEEAEDTLAQDIAAEETRAKEAEEVLDGKIDAEETRAKGAEQDLADDISDEETRAKAAEEGLGQDISAEETRAKGAEEDLDERVQAIEDDYVESVNGKKGVVVLSAADIKAGNQATVQANLERIDEELNRIEEKAEDLVDDEKEAREDADDALDQRVSALETKTNNLMDVGSEQVLKYGTSFPKISLANARLIYNAFTSGINVIIKWTVMSSIPLEFAVVATDCIGVKKSFDIIVHNKYSVSYSFEDASEADYADVDVIDLIPTTDKVLTLYPVGPDGDPTQLVGCHFKVYDDNDRLLVEGTYQGAPLQFSMPLYQGYKVEVTTPTLTIGGVVYFNPTLSRTEGIMTADVTITATYASTSKMSTLSDVKAFLALPGIDEDTKRAALVSTETNDFTVDVELTNPETQAKYTMPVRIVAVDNFKKLVNGQEVTFFGAKCQFAYCLPDTKEFDQREQVLATGETFQSGIFYYQGTSATVGDQSFTPLTEGVDYQVGDTVGANIYKHAWSNTQYGTGNSSTAMLMRYGSNIYHESNIDKWLNAAGLNWFVSSHLGDILGPSYANKHGFKDWFESADLNAIEDNVAFGLYERANFELTGNKIYRKFVLLSGTEVAGSVNANEDVVFDYWKYLNGGVINNAANANRTITKVNAKTTKQTIWLRSPDRSNSTHAWYLSNSGTVGSGSAFTANGVAPLFVI